MDTKQTSDLQILLDSYTVHVTSGNEPPTLMEIAGFPNWENVYSNILAFLVDSQEAHGFNQLFIRALLAAYKNWCPDTLALHDLEPESIQATEWVQREVVTASNKRIDILLHFADVFVCIENKIWSGLYNDLGQYRKHCESLTGGRNDKVIGIVLSPQRATDPSVQDNGFVSITYGDLVEQVRLRMGKFIDTSNTHFQYLLLDFLEQANRLSRTTSMDDHQRAFLNFWRENDKKIDNIQSMCDELWNVLRAKEKAQAHIEQCNASLTRFERDVFKTWIYKSRVAVFDLADDVQFDQGRLFLDVEFHPLRISHVLGKRHGSNTSAIASRIAEKCGIEFDVDLERPKFVIEQSAFDESVRTQAVKVSVKILKEIATMSHSQDRRDRSMQ